jgi:hypothetical protein
MIELVMSDAAALIFCVVPLVLALLVGDYIGRHRERHRLLSVVVAIGANAEAKCKFLDEVSDWDADEVIHQTTALLSKRLQTLIQQTTDR